MKILQIDILPLSRHLHYSGSILYAYLINSEYLHLKYLMVQKSVSEPRFIHLVFYPRILEVVGCM
jgi:hypothetical protein